jgi:hypothetical protein
MTNLIVTFRSFANPHEINYESYTCEENAGSLLSSKRSFPCVCVNIKLQI